jgi:N-acetylneuraminic acid mutarotase
MGKREKCAVVAVLMSAVVLGCEQGPPWQEITDHAIPARWGHVAVYDASRDRMLVFAGQGADGQQRNDVWALDLASLQWQQVATSAGPTPRTDLAAVLDPVGDRLIAVDGREGLTTSISEAWALDLASNVWSRMPSAPPARHDVPAATDGQHAWVFGGAGVLFQSLDDLWQLDLATDTWTQLPDDGLRPIARGSSSLAYFDGALYLYGGHDVAFVRRDAWRYDLTLQRWRPLSFSGSSVAGAHFGYGFDPVCQALILVGGDNLDNYDTSLSDGLVLGGPARMSKVVASPNPHPRDHPSLIIDEARHRLVLFGGGSIGDGLGTLGDGWTFQLDACP